VARSSRGTRARRLLHGDKGAKIRQDGARGRVRREESGCQVIFPPPEHGSKGKRGRPPILVWPRSREASGKGKLAGAWSAREEACPGGNDAPGALPLPPGPTALATLSRPFGACPREAAQHRSTPMPRRCLGAPKGRESIARAEGPGGSAPGASFHPGLHPWRQRPRRVVPPRPPPLAEAPPALFLPNRLPHPPILAKWVAPLVRRFPDPKAVPGRGRPTIEPCLLPLSRPLL
jgi:hypothetical protein